MSTAPGTRTSAIHPLSAEPSDGRVLGEVFAPNANQTDSTLLVRFQFDHGGTFRVDIDDVTNYE